MEEEELEKHEHHHHHHHHHYHEDERRQKRRRIRKIIRSVIFVVLCLVAVAAVKYFMDAGDRVLDGDGMENTPTLLLEVTKETAAEEGSSLSRAELYRYTNGTCTVCFTSREPGEETETQSTYLADSKVEEAVSSIITKNKVYCWADGDNDAEQNGISYTLKYLMANGSYLRLTEGNMPGDAHAVLESLQKCLLAHVTEKTENQ